MTDLRETLAAALSEFEIESLDVQERQFPGERWFIIYVDPAGLVAAQSAVGDIESRLRPYAEGDESVVVAVRPRRVEPQVLDQERPGLGRLHGRKIDQLIQLLEARSRASDALPSLEYVEDPRASLAATVASRHQLVFGRRGVGKTALLLESRRIAEQSGFATAWINAHVLRDMTPAAAFAACAASMIDSLRTQAGKTSAKAFEELDAEKRRLTSVIDDSREGRDVNRAVVALLPGLNAAFRQVLRPGLTRLYAYIDDFYLIRLDDQPRLLDLLAGMLRDCDGWLKIASIERLTRPWDPSNRVGLEVPHDASKIELDVTLEDPAEAQQFLEALLGNYVRTVGLRGPESIAKSEARGRLVLASGGVPRDYLNLVASSIVVARTNRKLAKELGKEDVAQAAGQSARSKRRDLEQDVTSENASNLLEAQDRIAHEVRQRGYTFFRVDIAHKGSPTYELLAQLVDLRFAHVVQSGLSDQHRPGVKYEAFVLALSEYSDVRLKRGLNVLDLDSGRWSLRQTGQQRSVRVLNGTQLRDQLRQSPLIDLVSLNDLVSRRRDGVE